MTPVVDETAGDLPVRDVGLTRGGLMAAQTADPQRLFRFPREHLEDLCLRLQEENSVLKQHTRTQEQRLRRMSTRLTRLRQASPGSGGGKDRDMEDTIQELEARVVMLESQKGVLQNKLSLAKQHIMDMGAHRPYNRVGLNFLTPDGKLEDPGRDFAHVQAQHAETVLELQKTRNLLLLEHQIAKDLQVFTHKM
uniref:RPGR interacting protein 1 n=1 Tax=Oryzias latipes TaxID=8090 RepID=A0A3P9JEP8_ORYLA